MIDILSNSAEKTIELGRKIGKHLRGGEVLALVGALGSGKTHFIKGIAAGAGAGQSQKVTSPTFVLINEYTGRFNIYHIDAYRLDKVSDFEMLGFDDLLEPGSVVLIEWADKVETALHDIDVIRVELAHVDETGREIRITNAPDYIVCESFS